MTREWKCTMRNNCLIKKRQGAECISPKIPATCWTFSWHRAKARSGFLPYLPLMVVIVRRKRHIQISQKYYFSGAVKTPRTNTPVQVKVFSEKLAPWEDAHLGDRGVHMETAVLRVEEVWAAAPTCKSTTGCCEKYYSTLGRAFETMHLEDQG